MIKGYKDAQAHFLSSLASMPAYAGLKFVLTSVQRVTNHALEEEFHASMRYFYQQGYHSAEHPIRSVYHGTRRSNIDSILRDNLSMDSKGATDSGWFGAGMYFSRHADYVMQYYTCGGFRRVEVGDKGVMLRFDILPGRMRRLDSTDVGAERTDLFDSNCTPSEFEYVMFDSRHVLPRYQIEFEVRRAEGAAFDGSHEQVGPPEVNAQQAVEDVIVPSVGPIASKSKAVPKKQPSVKAASKSSFKFSSAK
jgi:hypothetical protein